MKNYSISVLTLSFLLLTSSSVQAQKSAKPEFRTLWSAANTEISSASFASNGKSILICRRGHMPDGHEAESYGEKEIAAMDAKQKKDPRWNDPEIAIVAIPKGSVEKVDYGWSPISSKDDSRVFYSHQNKPITGKRVLAETQATNEICAYDKLTKKISILAKPAKGYFDQPLLSPDGRWLAYEICDVVNGAYGGCVGLGLIDLSNGKNKIPLKPAEHHKLPDLIRSPFWAQDQLVAVREIPKRPGTYMSDAYEKEIVNCTDTAKVIYKSKAKSEDAEFKARLSSDNQVDLVDDDKHLRLDAKTGKTTPAPKGSAESYLSPDKKFRVVQNDNIEVQDAKTGKAILKMRRPADSSAEGCLDPQFIWSADSSMLAMIIDKAKNKNGSQVFDRSELKILDLKNSKF